MAVTVKLYKNSSDPFVVHKNLNLIATKTCEITKEASVDNLEILLDNAAGLQDINYAHIDKYSRYYFAVPRVNNGNQITMQLSSDPLTSFWGSVSTSPCIAERSTSAPNPEITDDLLPFKNQPKYIFRKMQTGFTPTSSGGCYILTVGGK